LERVAWGFWNPFSMTFDRHGRLIAVDNDPDHRGPNRLLHIVPGGDYGFKKTYGRYGLHPLQAWDGELPGTLPMIDGIGEAPTAVIDANRAALPPDYRDTLNGATWSEHNLTLYRPSEAGASLKPMKSFCKDWVTMRRNPHFARPAWRSARWTAQSMSPIGC
jgi:hypothetical protein